MYSKLLYNLLFFCLFSNTLQAQLPHLFPTKNKDTIANYREKENKYMIGINFGKMILRPIFAGGFTIDVEAHKMWKKRWAYGFETGYTEYYWKSSNSQIHNKGAYFKPMISYVKKELDVIFMVSLGIPMGIFDEMGQLEVGNIYYTSNPKYLNYYRKNQFFIGTEVILTGQVKLDDTIAFGFGVRYAPYIYRPNVKDDVPMNTRYFAGSGYNANYNDTNSNNSDFHPAFALFAKLFVHF